MATPGRGRADYLELGDWNAVCWQCGRKRKASMLTRNWQGYWACPEHNEPRHPQDFVRGVPDNPTTPFVQAAVDSFITTSYSSSPVDTISLSPEVVTKDVNCVPIDRIISGTDVGTPLGGSALGEDVLAGGGGGGSPTFENQILLVDVAVVSADFAVAPAESVTLSEVVSVVYTFDKSLGATALGTITLGG